MARILVGRKSLFALVKILFGYRMGIFSLNRDCLDCPQQTRSIFFTATSSS